MPRETLDEDARGGGSRRINYVDGLRGLAVLSVVLFHSAIWASLARDGYLFRSLSIGRAGVDVFLVLSGFCLFFPLLGRAEVRKVETLDYLRRRIRRIAPPYFVAMVVVTLASWFAYLMLGEGSRTIQVLIPASMRDFAINTLAHLSMLHGLSNVTAHAFDGAFWSISLEWQFYLWFLPLAALSRHRIALAIAIPIAISLVYRIAFAIGDPVFLRTFVGNELSLGRLVEFAAGMAAARYMVARSQEGRGLRSRSSCLLLLVAFAIAIFYEILSEGIGLFLPFAWAFAGFSLLIVAGSISRLKGLLESRPIIFIGRISFSIYLIHGSVMMLLTVVLMKLGVGITIQRILVMTFAPLLAVAAGYVFFQLIERHFLPRSMRSVSPGGAAVPLPA